MSNFLFLQFRGWGEKRYAPIFLTGKSNGNPKIAITDEFERVFADDILFDRELDKNFKT